MELNGFLKRLLPKNLKHILGLAIMVCVIQYANNSWHICDTLSSYTLHSLVAFCLSFYRLINSKEQIFPLASLAPNNHVAAQLHLSSLFSIIAASRFFFAFVAHHLQLAVSACVCLKGSVLFGVLRLARTLVLMTSTLCSACMILLRKKGIKYIGGGVAISVTKNEPPILSTVLLSVTIVTGKSGALYWQGGFYWQFSFGWPIY